MKNKIINLSNQESYYVVSIVPFQNKNYYITNRLENNATMLTDNFVVFEEYVQDGQIELEQVTNGYLIYNVLDAGGFYSLNSNSKVKKYHLE